MRNKLDPILALGLLILVSTACNFSFSTASLSDLKFGKDKNASGAETTFKPEDEIFAVTAVNNSMGKTKVKFRLLFDKVEGAPTGAVAHKIEKELPVEGNGAVSFNFSLPGGFTSGSYQAEFVMIDENGKELDRKTGNFTIVGGNGGKTAKTDKPLSDDTKPEADKSDNEDSGDN